MTAHIETQRWSPPKAWRGKQSVGMPPLKSNRKPVTFYEFWPMQLFYAPLVPLITLLCLRYGGFQTATYANPSFPYGGVVGERKSLIYDLFEGAAREALPEYLAFSTDKQAAAVQAVEILAKWQEMGQSLPAVIKPDIGCRGKGVRLAESEQDISDYIAAFPDQAPVVLQEYVDMEGEAGVFYIRYPGQRKGRIFAITLKYFPYVTGDGISTLRRLIENDERAGGIADIYLPRHAAHLDTVPAKGEDVRLTFAGSHSGGTIFRDGTEHKTEMMRAAFDRLADDIPGFYFGRYDVRFDDFEAFKRGEGFRILELNGASGEATSIWDSSKNLLSVYWTLTKQYYHLWRVGWINRKRGEKGGPKGLELLRVWRKENELIEQYPLMQ